MIKNPAVSVVMPLYNGEKFLKEAIESILNQTFKDFEFLIIYDESSDNSATIINSYQRNDPRIRIINGDKNGISGALRKGIKESKGNYIARHDADDISLLNRLKIQLTYMAENNLDICGGDFISIGKDNEIKNSNIVAKKDHEILLTMASNVPFAHPSVMIKKSFLIDHNLNYGAFGQKCAEDLDLWMHMFNKGAKFGNLDKVLIKYRLLPNSLSSINNKIIKKEVSEQFNIFVNENCEKFRDALTLFCNEKKQPDYIERIAVKALFRYVNFDFNIKLVLKCFKKVSLYNFIFGFLSYVNSKYF